MRWRSTEGNRIEQGREGPRVIISACLAGLATRYDGGSQPHPRLEELARRCVLIPLCPEVLGGLGIPRPPCIFVGGDGEAVVRGKARVMSADGINRTEHFLAGARATLQVMELVRPSYALFKEGSPSCGLRRVDIQGVKSPGKGVTTALMESARVPVYSEEDVPPL